MMNQRPQLAPFCWGQAACFKANAKVCAKCGHADDCAKKVLGNLIAISSDISVSDLIVATRSFLDKRGVEYVDEEEGSSMKMRFATTTNISFDTSDIEHSIAGISIRAQQIARATARAGIDMRADAKRGTNSFKTIGFKPNYMADIQDLINQSSIFTRDMVKNAIREKRDLKYSALNNSVSFAMSAMQAMGFIKDIGGGKYAVN